VLNEINTATGDVVRRRAKFVPPEGTAVSDTQDAPSAVQAGAVLDSPADSPDPDVVVAPSGLKLRLPIYGTDSTFSGSFNTFCYYNGSYHMMMDFTVDSLKIMSVANTGGHKDAGHASAKPKGESSRYAGHSTSMGEWPFVYSADSTSGDEHLLFYYTIYDSNQPAFCRGPKSPFPPFIFAKRWYSFTLEQITSRDGLSYPTPTSQHFDINYATPGTAEKTYQVAELYRLNYPTGTVRLTAATLIFGGLQDVANNWTGEHAPQGMGHIRHRIGTDVDLNAALGGGGYERLKAIGDACVSAGFIHQIDEGNHRHCYDFCYSNEVTGRNPCR
jgi:hypothetical protein